MSDPVFTHRQLVDRGVRWARSGLGCQHAFGEIVTAASESPDVLGWSSATGSHLVEVKVSRQDFRRDKDKHSRRILGAGMGQNRWFLTPPGLVKGLELPPGWGLAEAFTHSVRIVVHAESRLEWDHGAERIVILSALRRWELGVPFDKKTGRFQEIGHPEHPGAGVPRTPRRPGASWETIRWVGDLLDREGSLPLEELREALVLRAGDPDDLDRLLEYGILQRVTEDPDFVTLI